MLLSGRTGPPAGGSYATTPVTQLYWPVVTDARLLFDTVLDNVDSCLEMHSRLHGRITVRCKHLRLVRKVTVW